MLKKLNLIILLLFAQISLFGQASFGGNAKLVLAKLNDSETLTSYSFGLVYQQSLAGNFGFVTELNGIKRGGKYGNSSIEFNSIETPLLLYYKLSKSGLEFRAGGYTAFTKTINNNVKTVDNEVFTIEMIQSEKNYVDSGLRFSIGLPVIKNKFSRLMFHLGYNRGISNIQPLSKKEQRFTLGLSYLGR